MTQIGFRRQNILMIGCTGELPTRQARAVAGEHGRSTACFFLHRPLCAFQQQEPRSLPIRPGRKRCGKHGRGDRSMISCAASSGTWLRSIFAHSCPEDSRPPRVQRLVRLTVKV
jgi:hypothetical protein